MRNRIGGLVVVVSVLLGVSGSTLAFGRTYVASNCTNARYKPREIIIACGDGATWLSALRWSQWGKAGAHGRGTLNRRTCDPNCATGGTRHYPVNVRLARPRYCADTGREQFSRAHVTFTKGVPPGLSRHSTLGTSCGALPF
jgi:hypothetical protein